MDCTVFTFYEFGNHLRDSAVGATVMMLYLSGMILLSWPALSELRAYAVYKESLKLLPDSTYSEKQKIEVPA